jgi:hypothetical protein
MKNQEKFEKVKQFARCCPRCLWTGIDNHTHSIYCYRETFGDDVLDCCSNEKYKCEVCNGDGFIINKYKITLSDDGPIIHIDEVGSFKLGEQIK